MKNLKIRLGLFSLLAILAVSVFLTSCQQETILPELEETLSIERHYFATPIGFDNKPETEVDAYFESLTTEEATKLEESYRVSSYLESINELKNVTDSMADGAYYSEIDLSRFLTTAQLEALNTYELTTESIAKCNYWYRWACYNNSPWCSGNNSLAIDRAWCNGSYRYTGYCLPSCNIH